METEYCLLPFLGRGLMLVDVRVTVKHVMMLKYSFRFRNIWDIFCPFLCVFFFFKFNLIVDALLLRPKCHL